MPAVAVLRPSEPSRKDNQPFYKLFKIVSVTIPAKCHLTRELAHLLYLLQDVQDVCGACEELLCLSLQAVPLRLYLDKGLPLSPLRATEPRRHILNEISHPEARIDELTLRCLFAIEAPVVLIARNVQKSQ